MNRTFRMTACAALFAALVPLAASATTVTALPTQPAFGQNVSVSLGNTEWPQYLPASRFTRSGGSIVVDFDYLLQDFGPGDPAFGYRAVPLGELVPGDYSVLSRLNNMALPGTAPQTLRTTFAVNPPEAWGVFLVPQAPGEWEAANVLVHSAVYFDPSTLRAALAGNVIRVDFDYAPDAPVGGTIPPGYASYAAVGIDGLAPGAYRVEAYGRPLPDGEPTQYFTLDFSIAAPMPIVEFYHARLGHYFMAGGPAEVKLLDSGVQGDWKRTGQKFKGWLRQADAPASAQPVCRFYAYGPNSHFFTADAFECQLLKDQEQAQRAEAATAGTPFLGWGYEGIGFWALMPQGGQCPLDAAPVFRNYNDRAAEHDSNHRFTMGTQLHGAMSARWVDEGVQLCSPL